VLCGGCGRTVNSSFLCKTHIAIQHHFDDPLRMRDNTALQYQGGHLKLTTKKMQAFPLDLD